MMFEGKIKCGADCGASEGVLGMRVVKNRSANG